MSLASSKADLNGQVLCLYVLGNNKTDTGNIIFTIKETKLYVRVMNLSNLLAKIWNISLLNEYITKKWE